ncbi:hypothetical protein [Primorskyibacter flagellatus]|uniref:Uncharacterized protein n=1 Tax=Primorskyibacter flagellatus TaxID=1387277 RepID=A0A1W2C5Z2_9RHOB|nr:hypothetical protein [Primorskyibacter flagellatus]SMC80675.1 hypothetical protein SAMN06295998_10663 [Primorskyibacter flagellatus]
MGSAAIWFGALLLSALSFLFGKIFAQSERILDQKRKAYETFLTRCPAPDEAHTNVDLKSPEFQRSAGLLTLYSSPKVTLYAAEYFQKFEEAQPELVEISEPGHPRFIEVMSYYNRMVWEMRSDVMMWSIFAPTKHSKEYKQGSFGKKVP